MKIEKVHSRVVNGAYFVSIETDNGLTGIGQSSCWVYPQAVDAIVDVFKGYLIGVDPLRIEHHWNYLYRMGPFRGSVLSGAVSAVDMALWDIKGKHYGAPVWDLLGGKCRDKLRLLVLVRGTTLDALLANVKSALDDGFTAIKFDPIFPGYQDRAASRVHSQTVEAVAAVRELVSDDVDLVFELHRKLTPLQSVPLLEAMAAFNPLFIEDPIQIDSISVQAGLAPRTRAPVGYGERLHSIWEFQELLSQGGSQILRCSLGLAGGISHCRKIAAIGESYHAAVVSHNFLGPVITAATAHLSSSIPNFTVMEYYPPAEEGEKASAFTCGHRRDGGYLIVSDAPGLGVTFDETAVDTWLGARDHALHLTPLRQDGSVALAV